LTVWYTSQYEQLLKGNKENHSPQEDSWSAAIDFDQKSKIKDPGLAIWRGYTQSYHGAQIHAPLHPRTRSRKKAKCWKNVLGLVFWEKSAPGRTKSRNTDGPSWKIFWPRQLFQWENGHREIWIASVIIN